MAKKIYYYNRDEWVTPDIPWLKELIKEWPYPVTKDKFSCKAIPYSREKIKDND